MVDIEMRIVALLPYPHRACDAVFWWYQASHGRASAQRPVGSSYE